jgi:hypothetical protein
MPTKTLGLFCAFNFYLLCGHCQTSEQFALKFTQLSSFEVRPGIVMTVRYSSDNQACQLLIEGTHYRTTGEPGRLAELSSKVQQELLDELAPKQERGERTSPWLSRESYVAGGAYYTKIDYERITTEVFGSNNGGDQWFVITWKLRTCSIQSSLSRRDSLKPTLNRVRP